MMFMNIQLFAHKKGVGSSKTAATAKVNVWARNAPTDSLFLRATCLLNRTVPEYTRATM